MSTTYESSTTTSTSEGIGLDRFYIKHYLGILKVVEIILDMIAFICASVWLYWGSHGGGWVQFVTMSAFVTTLLLYIFHLFRIIYKLPGPWGLIEFVYYILYSLMMLIAAIVCATKAHWHSSIGAAAFFTFAATAVYIVDTFFAYRNWQSGRLSSSSHASTSATTTTTTTKETYETRVQY